MLSISSDDSNYISGIFLSPIAVNNPKQKFSFTSNHNIVPGMNALLLL